MPLTSHQPELHKPTKASDEAYTHASFPISFPNTDIKVKDVDVRVFASGDDRSMWDVQFCSDFTDRWHTASTEQAKAILDYLETTDPLTWGEILCTARTNPTLAA